MDVDDFMIPRKRGLKSILWKKERNVNEIWIKLDDLISIYSGLELLINYRDMILWIKENCPTMYMDTVHNVPIWHDHKHIGEEADYNIYKMDINQRYQKLYPNKVNDIGNDLKLYKGEDTEEQHKDQYDNEESQDEHDNKEGEDENE